MELSVLHLYWFTRSDNEGYVSYFKWLDGQQAPPSFAKQIHQVLRKVSGANVISRERLKRLDDSLQKMYVGLCEYNHGPRMSDSMAGLSKAHTGLSLDSFYFYLAMLDLLISQIIYVYVLAYPMILFPVDRRKKFGVSGPIGMFADASGAAILKSYLGAKNVETLRTSLSQLQAVKDRLEFFENQHDLSDDEQEEDWDDFVKQVETKDNPTEWPARIAMSRSYYRTLRWFLNYIHSRSAEEEPNHDEIKGIFEGAKSW